MEVAAKRPFEKVFLINLKFREDRLAEFEKSYPRSILGNYQIWNAVLGDRVKHPEWWTAGNGAWGCYRSHMQILEHCYNEGISSYLVLEDDALFLPEFWHEFPSFMNALPEDWEQCYLGGQLLWEIANPPIRVNEHCLIPYNVNRTHAFGVSSLGYEKLYKHLNKVPFEHGHHIDHHLGKIHSSKGIKCYVPNKWMVGQNESSSNISGKRTDVNFWINPADCAREHWLYKYPVCVVLMAPPEVAKDLQTIGWHQGFYKNDEGLDQGVNSSIASLYPNIGLGKWFTYAQREVVRDNMVVPCLYHPIITREVIKRLNFTNLIVIEADTVSEAHRQLEESEIYQSARAVTPVPREIATSEKGPS